MIWSRTQQLRRLFGVVAILALTASPAVWAAGGEEVAKEAVAAPAVKGIGSGLIAVGAALAIGLSALATGIAQARIGAAGIGAIAENPKRLGAVIMLVAIPETVAILGFVIAYLILTT